VFFFFVIYFYFCYFYIYVFANVYTFTRSYEYINKRNRIFSPFKVYRANAFIVIPNAENRIFPSRLRPWTISATCKHKNIRNIRTKFAFVYLYTFVYIYIVRACAVYASQPSRLRMCSRRSGDSDHDVNELAAVG